ncbi:ATP phosphoribosyltransferase regulatory subunit [Paracoccus sp. Z330]|uniref:ATP phosphoribosyltransferase regulatory subunit n=1 Tax=Paracoccus onchidii TaxID=3017813 RepID=A0ABT4ZEQ6_9RHOB|nr:ATP phosphoribosyltransferase regulatory subunit [Paracoccus onchidii]MDB6177800.1 ATP phosphoribosyltransferase regulatory subunit [Paracoccus onchidii]
MISKRDKRNIGQRMLAAFQGTGAEEIVPDILLPAESLLDLYGEDIRARAYVTTDPIRGEMMLRPDFTVPVVQAHMENGAEPARYCYLGEVFRKQDMGDTRPHTARDNEYLQAGFELFSRDPDADAEVFAMFHDLLHPYGANAVVGDIGLLMAAVRSLPVSQARRDALLHHIWRPGRFARLLDRFSAPAPERSFPETQAAWAGLRGQQEMEQRMARLQADADTPPLPEIWAQRLRQLFSLRGNLAQVSAQLSRIAEDWPDIAASAQGIILRTGALAERGIDPGKIRFDAEHGRSTMEYYDGFTFSFGATTRDDWPPLASGGRYDALTRVLGKGREIPAVGGILRPGLIAELEQGQ